MELSRISLRSRLARKRKAANPGPSGIKALELGDHPSRQKNILRQQRQVAITLSILEAMSTGVRNLGAIVTLFSMRFDSSAHGTFPGIR